MADTKNPRFYRRVVVEAAVGSIITVTVELRPSKAQDGADELEALLSTFDDVPFRVLRTAPGDVVIFTTPGRVTPDTAAHLTAAVEHVLPGVKAFVLGDGLTVDGVIRGGRT